MTDEKPPQASFKLIQFPKDKIFRHRVPFEILGPKEATLAVEKAKLDHLSYVAQVLIMRLGENLDEFGVDDSGDSYEKDLQFLHEAILSLLKRAYDLDHKFQQIADDLEVDPELMAKFLVPVEEDDDEPEPPRYA